MTEGIDDIEVLEQALQWWQAGLQPALVTVIKTWGSSPRPPGSLMVMNHSGQFVGSLSGGCIEESLVASYCRNELTGPQPTRLDFGVAREDAARMGLPCGGRLEVLIEYLDSANSIQPVLNCSKSDELITRTVHLASGDVDFKPGNANLELQLTETELSKTFGPTWQLLLIGDGQLARHLASMAAQVDFRVSICDPREGYAHFEQDDAIYFTRSMPDDAVAALADHTRTAIVTLAHDPRQDDLGLTAALQTQAFYIGALGSRRSAQARSQRLVSLGYNAKQIDRIHAPAGLPIGSKRPAEIALSILAQIIAIRNGMQPSSAQVNG